MRTIDQTTQEVLNLASRHFQVPANSLTPDDDFFKKLGINSLQALELRSRLENHFNIELPDYEVQGVSDFRTLASKHFQVPANSLAPDDDFFKKLGINSLQALELLSRLENHFNIELPDYEVQGVSDFRTLASRIQSRL